jgi:8-oxo-dGTP pyrophosphatase MutT (NUDIX family)
MAGELGEPEGLLKAPKYRAWKRNVEANGCTIRKVELLKELPKQDGSLLFALLRARVEDPQGRALPAYALLRGHAVVIVTEVVDRENGERRFLMLRQRRIGNGADTLEFPAGMLDEDVGDPAGVAVKELKEETGLDVPREKLFRLCDKPLYTSPGLDDEAIHFFGCSLELPGDRYRALDGGETGKAEEGEYIRLGLWEYAKALEQIDSVQVRYAFSLWFDHLRHRPVPG